MGLKDESGAAERLRALPAVETVLQDARLGALAGAYSRAAVMLGGAGFDVADPLGVAGRAGEDLDVPAVAACACRSTTGRGPPGSGRCSGCWG